MKEQGCFESSELYRAFPESAEVFSGFEQEVLLPLGLVSFRHFDERYDHPVLIALPIEPKDGYLGESSSEHHTELCRENWLSYTFRDGAWKVDCDPAFFLKMHPDFQDSEKLERFYHKNRERYEKVKAFFGKHGFIQFDPDQQAQRDSACNLISLGGPIPSGQNWDADEDFDYRYNAEFDEEEPLILNAQGDPYVFIGSVTEFFFKDGGDTAHFFYEPNAKSVLMVVDYS